MNDYIYPCCCEDNSAYCKAMDNIFELEQKDIEYRYTIHRALLEHPKSLIRALFQDQVRDLGDIIRTHNHDIFISEEDITIFGSWLDYVQKIECSDFITLYAGVMNIDYKDAIHELFSYIISHEKVFKGVHEDSNILVQEKK